MHKKEEQEEKCFSFKSTVNSIALSLAERCSSKSSLRSFSSDLDLSEDQTSRSKCSIYQWKVITGRVFWLHWRIT